jgi:hypothetical protein
MDSITKIRIKSKLFSIFVKQVLKTSKFYVYENKDYYIIFTLCRLSCCERRFERTREEITTGPKIPQKIY